MRKTLFLSLLCGILLALSFPPLRLGFLAYIGLIPFFIILQNADYKQAIKWGYLTGLFLNIGTLYWISWVTIPGTIAAILYLPIYLVIYAVLHTFIRFRLGTNYLIITIPFLWTGIEYMRSLGVLGFPWTSLAYTQTYYLSLIQYVSFTSLYGVTFWIVTINVVLFEIIYNYRNLQKVLMFFILLLLLFLCPFIYGKLIIPKDTPAQEKIRIALMQGNIDPFVKSDIGFWEENFEIYKNLTLEAIRWQPQLIIWPETAVPCYLRYTPEYLRKIRNLVSELKRPLITGAHDAEFLTNGSYITHNAVFLILPEDDRLDSYSKLHLVPFGERVPFTELLPLLKNLLESLEMGEGNFSPGDQIKTFIIPLANNTHSTSGIKNIRMPVVVCFESLFPDLVRKFVTDNNADLLAIITNDGWFKRSAAPYHHAQAAVFRAIENRISIARSANTGVSMFIDAYGRTFNASPIFKTLYLIGELPLRNETTFFMVYGNIFSVSISVLNLVPLLISFFKKDREAMSV